jgi:hypothetical protein
MELDSEGPGAPSVWYGNVAGTVATRQRRLSNPPEYIPQWLKPCIFLLRLRHG